MKHCPRCDQTKPVSEFAADRSRRDGRMNRCKDCDNAKTRAWYDRTGGTAASARYRSNREKRKAQNKAWRTAHPDRVREIWRAQYASSTPDQRREQYMKRHGGIEEWNRLWQTQEGRCYLCRRVFLEGDAVHVDHDHTCCPGTRSDPRSCRACRRGLAHAACNQIIGLIGEDMTLLRVIADQFEPAQHAARQRIAALPPQGILEFGKVH